MKNDSKKAKIKILHLLTTGVYSGAENVAITIIEETKKDFESIYACTNGPIVNILKEKNIEYIVLNNPTRKYIKKAIKAIKPNLIHAHGFQMSVNCSLILSRIPFISHLHNNKPWIKKVNLRSIMFLIAGLRAKKILIVSNSIKKEYVFSKPLKKKFINVGNPVDTKKILEQIKDKNDDKIYDICCVGRLTAAKDPYRFLDILNEIIKVFPKIKTIWVGDGELKKECIAKAKEMNLENNIDFIGFKKNPYLYMIKSKIFVLTSKWEGYGLVAFEALTLGLPCIVSNVGGLPSIVDNKCGYLCNNNNDFIENILDLLKNEDKLIKYKENAINKSKELDNCNKYTDTIKKIYLSVNDSK